MRALRRAALGSTYAYGDDGVWTGVRSCGVRRIRTAGDKPDSRDPACARYAPPSVGGPRVATRQLLAHAAQGRTCG